MYSGDNHLKLVSHSALSLHSVKELRGYILVIRASHAKHICNPPYRSTDHTASYLVDEQTYKYHLPDNCPTSAQELDLN
jgi:hypothetical protein